MASNTTPQTRFFLVANGPGVLHIAAYISDLGTHNTPRQIWVTVGKCEVLIKVEQIDIEALPMIDIRAVIMSWSEYGEYVGLHCTYTFSALNKRQGGLTVLGIRPTCQDCGEPMELVSNNYSCPICGVTVERA